MSVREIVRSRLERRLDRQYNRKLKKYMSDYNSLIAGMNEAKSGNGGGEASGEIELVVFGDGIADAQAKKKIRRYFNENSQTLLLYGDEDVMNKRGESDNPWLKPDWSPDAYLCRDYLGSLIAVRAELLERLTDEERASEARCHDRLVELAGGYERGCRTIGHLKNILFHRREQWPMPGEGRPGGCSSAVEESMDDAYVSVVIPSKDNAAVLKRCLVTLVDTALELPYEIIIVDNGSNEENQGLIRDEVRRIEEERNRGRLELLRGITYLYEPMEFNFSRMCNRGVEQAKGNLLLFLNDDIEAVSPGWMGEMAGKALEPWAGAVGIKLWYPDSQRIQHAGVVNVDPGPMHKLRYLEDNECYYDGRNRGVWNMLAVTAACMMVRRSVFEEAGRFAEQIRVAFNDVDLCFTFYEMGLHNIQINTMHLLHHESLSRGDDETEEKQRRMQGEWEELYARHPGLKERDPYYHPCLCRKNVDSRIRLAFYEGCVFPDERTCRPWQVPGNARQDECLRFGLEIAADNVLQGYAVVLGSDNACFRKYLLLQSKEDETKVYRLDFLEQYRVDLLENIPDQKNVGLCGFRVLLTEKLPVGDYRVGVVAKDRISGLELINYSAKVFCVR